MHILMGKI